MVNIRILGTHYILSGDAVSGRGFRGSVRSPGVTVRFIGRITFTTIR